MSSVLLACEWLRSARDLPLSWLGDQDGGDSCGLLLGTLRRAGARQGLLGDAKVTRSLFLFFPPLHANAEVDILLWLSFGFQQLVRSLERTLASAETEVDETDCANKTAPGGRGVGLEGNK